MAQKTDGKDIIIDGGDRANRTLILAPGAGAGKEHYFMGYFARELASEKLRIVRFNFPFMDVALKTGRRRPPDTQPILLETWRTIISKFRTEELIIGGKSMGGRIASIIADKEKPNGLVCLGYPFHKPGNLENPRVEHLRTIKTPTLICQGTRDPFGTKSEADSYQLSKKISFQWLQDGDHSFKPRKRSGHTEVDNLATSVKAIKAFVCKIFN